MDESALGAKTIICIPTFNERENLEPLVAKVLDELPGAHILVIDDNSPDGTGAIADRLHREDERVFVLHRERKEGLGRAYIAGFGWALDRAYEKIIEFDADFSHNPAYLPEMVRRLQSADVVVGSRRVPGGGVENWSLGRRLVSLGGSLYARGILGIPVRDLTGGFNGFTRAAIKAINYSTIRASGYAFQIEIKYRACATGLNVEEMPIVFPDRQRGSSKMSRAIFIEALLSVLKLKFGSKTK